MDAAQPTPFPGRLPHLNDYPSQRCAAALPAPAVVALLDSAGGVLLPPSRERAVAVLAPIASSDAAFRFLEEDPGAVVPRARVTR
ncbi:hypothetical protein PVAP13_9NG502814 [Panicum virgatum]|uniref:Uncharacterized protein n=1 Tax=Panicum virgatum TaxID=38727 RepID=A0A8T0MS14_PANVG|nr:hypothetical protein PVAP13_9NG502814 [Panicum virgatum]